MGSDPLLVAQGASQLVRRDAGTPLASFVGIFARKITTQLAAKPEG